MSKTIINGRLFEFDWLSDPENRPAQDLLRKHYQSPSRPVCGCLKDSRNRELVIKKRNRFFLAKLPGTGENHAHWCELYGANDTASSHGKCLPAIIEQGEFLNINLNSYLDLNINLNQSSVGGNMPNSNRAALTLLGLLNVSFQKSRINVWSPHRRFDRTINTIEKNVMGIAENILVRKRRLSDILVIPRWETDKANSVKQNRQILFNKTSKPGKGVIVIGIVNRWIESKKEIGGIGVGLDLLENLLWMPPETANAAQQSFGQLISEVKKKDRYIFAICTVFRSGEYLTIGDIGLMRVNKQFIPADSSYELQVADKLITERRAFSKPLRLESEDYLPDFVLHDCETDWLMEIFGIKNDVEYQAHKYKKLRHYKEHNINCWQWSPDKDDNIPPFPMGQTQ
jgi:hypothetical protein